MNDDVVRELTLLRELGFTHLDPAAAGTRSADVSAREDAAPAAAIVDARAAAVIEDEPLVVPPLAAKASADSGSPEWATLRLAALNCTACRLAGTRTNVVFGVGNENAELMFVGEAPGRDEDLQGEPFVGRAGQLLTDIIKAMKLTREQVYIANVIKCRPPENRNPEPDELDACRPYIQQQVALVQPKIIVTLGKFGLQSLTGKTYAISAIRGQWLDYNGVKLMPTYHPAYLLRTPAAKKDVWADMKKVMAELGITF